MVPHAVLNTGPQSAAITSSGRNFIPGIVPGGQRAGDAMKPAFLLRDINVMPIGLTPDLAAAGEEDLALFLTLSQETNMLPHLLLPIGYVAVETQTAVGSVQVEFIKNFMAQGTIWAPRLVGWRTLLGGAWTNYDLQIHIDYEQVEVPWMDWFIMWDFLDNVPTGTVEY